MQNTSHHNDVSTVEARQGRRRKGLLTVMGASMVIALLGMLLALVFTDILKYSGN
ncbi:MAG: hypothetical protein R3265_12185 [Hyphomonas sp.]|nr:hypothetical protein [Hyphomonas sp.]